MESDDASDEQADATGDPAPGELQFFLVRPETDFARQVGSKAAQQRKKPTRNSL